MGKVMGYVRVSSKDQNEGRQLVKMQELGVSEIHTFTDKVSGKDFDRPAYQLMRRNIKEGDLIYMDALDRLGRNYDEIINEWKYITRTVNADIVVLENKELFDSRKFKLMDTVDINGNRVGLGKLLEDQFLSMLAYVAEGERIKIKTRQAEGIALAQSQGKHLGRPKVVSMTPEFIIEYKRWKSNEITATRAVENLGISRAGFYRLVKEIEGGTAPC